MYRAFLVNKLWNHSIPFMHAINANDAVLARRMLLTNCLFVFLVLTIIKSFFNLLVWEWGHFNVYSLSCQIRSLVPSYIIVSILILKHILAKIYNFQNLSICPLILRRKCVGWKWKEDELQFGNICLSHRMASLKD